MLSVRRLVTPLLIRPLLIRKAITIGKNSGCFFPDRLQQHCAEKCLLNVSSEERKYETCLAPGGVVSADLILSMVQMIKKHEQMIKKHDIELSEARLSKKMILLGDLAVWTRDFLFKDALLTAPFLGDMYIFDEEECDPLESVLPGLGHFLCDGKIPRVVIEDDNIDNYKDNVNLFINHMQSAFNVDSPAVYKIIEQCNAESRYSNNKDRSIIARKVNMRTLEHLLDNADAHSPYEGNQHQQLKVTLTTALRRQCKNVVRRTAKRRPRPGV